LMLHRDPSLDDALFRFLNFCSCGVRGRGYSVK
jgi:hypothetical protein